MPIVCFLHLHHHQVPRQVGDQQNREGGDRKDAITSLDIRVLSFSVHPDSARSSSHLDSAKYQPIPRPLSRRLSTVPPMVSGQVLTLKPSIIPG